MFDPVTSFLLTSAPSVPDLDSSDIPRLLTRHYAELVAARLINSTESVDSTGTEDGTSSDREAWSLDRIADTYEIIASIEIDPVLRRAAAFVAGTAQQIISRRQTASALLPKPTLLDRDSIDPSLAAALLFLSAEQFADANEAGLSIPISRGSYDIMTLGLHIRDLARGRLQSIIDRSIERRREPSRGLIQNRALQAIAASLADGVELLAYDLMSIPGPEQRLGRPTTASDIFQEIVQLSTNVEVQFGEAIGGDLTTSYAGPAHLASLLISAAKSIESAALTKVPPPTGSNSSFWLTWLQYRAKDMPFIWPNHREAITCGFHETHKSAVLVLPTGAGKTTVSSLKIAAALSRKKKVLFLAPTHALVEQLTDDLQEIFPREVFGLEVSSEFDALLIDDSQLKDIEVMTPERCLAMLSFSPSSFDGVGLLVFDECHLLSPQSGKIGRSLDGMLCLLAFSAAAPTADMLFLSAMLKNGPEFARWITDLTKRQCVSIELLWKPSRQARGVMVYDAKEISSAITDVLSEQRRLDQKEQKRTKSVRAAAARKMLAKPYVVWGLQHNWLSSANSYIFTPLSNSKLVLGVRASGSEMWATPNANETSANIATSASLTGMKTVVFVNTKADAVGTASKISDNLNPIILNEAEIRLWDALVLELGHAKHSVFADGNFGAVPHNSSMLRLERTLAERVFKRPDGAQVIVATPTLAQGLNLPAHLAILAGDKRAGKVQGERENLEAHELLNAAARAGRAGHLANGVVVLIPEPIIKFKPGAALSEQIKSKLTSVLPEDDRCVVITDPLEVVLDRLMAGELDDRQVRYTVNRLAALSLSEGDATSQDNLITRSLGAFLARARQDEEDYLEKVGELWDAAKEAVQDNPDGTVVLLASQSGLPLDLLERLRSKLLASSGSLPITIDDWVDWTLSWLRSDTESRDHLLQDVERSAAKSVGKNATSPIDDQTLIAILPGIKGWISGKPINQIERDLGGNPEAKSKTAKMCPRARELVSTFIPRGVAFIIGIVSRMTEELDLISKQEDLEASMVQSLTSAVRRGYDTVAKLQYANAHKEILGRVQLHRAFTEGSLIVEIGLDDED